MASATVKKPFSAQPSAVPTLSEMLFGISSFWAEVGLATRIRVARAMRAADFTGPPVERTVWISRHERPLAGSKSHYCPELRDVTAADEFTCASRKPEELNPLHRSAESDLLGATLVTWRLLARPR